MTLEEAIEHAEERACGNDQCAKDHAQLSDWLRELRRARMEIDLLKALRDGFKADAQKYKAENDNMYEVVVRMHGLLLEKCEAPHEQYHGKPCESCAEDGTDDCPKVIARQLRELGVEVDE